MHRHSLFGAATQFLHKWKPPFLRCVSYLLQNALLIAKLFLLRVPSPNSFSVSSSVKSPNKICEFLSTAELRVAALIVRQRLHSAVRFVRTIKFA